MTTVATTDQTPNGKPSEPPPGLCCARCGCNHFYTLRTTKKQGGQIVRERKCRNCGRRIMTYEKAAFS